MTEMKGLFAATIAIFQPGLLAEVSPAERPGTRPSCAMVQTIESWTDIDETTVILETSPRRRYKVTFTAPCPDVKRATLALIQRPPSAGVCLSPGDSIIFARRSPGGSQNFDYDERCVIKTITAQAIEAR